MMVTKLADSPSQEEISIARGDFVDHSGVSKLILHGHPSLLELIVFNKNTHDELKFKALKKIAEAESNIFSLKIKKSLISKSLKTNNFGKKLYFENKQLLKLIKDQQDSAAKNIIKNHCNFFLSAQKSSEDTDFLRLTDDINKVRRYFLSLKSTDRRTFRPSFWNYIRMVLWADFFDDDQKVNERNNLILIDKLDPILSLNDWNQLDSLFENPTQFDSLIYGSFHYLALDLKHSEDSVIKCILQGNKIVDNFENLVGRIEKINKELGQKKLERDVAQRSTFLERAKQREINQKNQRKGFAKSGLQFLGDSGKYGTYDPVVNNRWP